MTDRCALPDHRADCASGARRCTSAVLAAGLAYEADVKRQAATLMKRARYYARWIPLRGDGYDWATQVGDFTITEWITERGRLRAVRR